MAKKLSWVMAVWAGTCAPAIHADVLQQFAVSGNFYEYDGSGNAFPGGSISGTETIDVTLGSIVEASLEAMVYGKSYSFRGAPTYQGAQANSASPDDPDQTPLAYEADFSNGIDELQLNLPIQGDIVGYGGGDLCSFDFGSCGAGNNAYFSYLGAQDLGLTFVNNGSLTPIGSPVITPEPSSLILLGTGFVSAAGALRRRLCCN